MNPAATPQLILRSEAMAAINSGQPFSLIYITADQRRGTGGKRIHVDKWMKVRHDMPADEMPGFMQKEFRRQKVTKDKKMFLIYNPAHRQVHPHPVHYRLMTWFNNKRIING